MVRRLFFRSIGKASLCLGLTVLFVGFQVTSAEASDPQKVISNLTQKIKSAGSAAPTLDLYYWPSLFDKMSSEEREAFGASSANELKSSMQRFFNAPEEFFRERIGAQFQGQNQQELAMIQPMLDSMIGQIKAKVDEANAELKNTSFEVGEATINGDRATVPVTTSHPSEGTKRQDIEMQKIEGKWYLVEPLQAGAQANMK